MRGRISSLIVVAFAGLPLFWVARTGHSTLAVQLAEGTMRQIVRGETISPTTLAETSVRLKEIDPASCHERHLWHRLILHLYRLDHMPVASAIESDQRMSEAREQARALVSCSPRHALGWVVLAWVGIATEGPQPEFMEMLALSYRLAPREGWLARARSPIAIRLYPVVDEALQSAIRSEFADLVQLRFFHEAVNALAQASPGTRESVLAATAHVPEEQRQLLARQISAAGLNLAVPGIDTNAQRPWR